MKYRIQLNLLIELEKMGIYYMVQLFISARQLKIIKMSAKDQQKFRDLVQLIHGECVLAHIFEIGIS